MCVPHPPPPTDRSQDGSTVSVQRLSHPAHVTSPPHRPSDHSKGPSAVSVPDPPPRRTSRATPNPETRPPPARRAQQGRGRCVRSGSVSCPAYRTSRTPQRSGGGLKHLPYPSRIPDPERTHRPRPQLQPSSHGTSSTAKRRRTQAPPPPLAYPGSGTDTPPPAPTVKPTNSARGARHPHCPLLKHCVPPGHDVPFPQHTRPACVHVPSPHD